MVNDINLIPKNKKSVSTNSIIVIITACVCIVVISLFYGYLLPARSRSILEARVAQQELNLEQLKEKQSSYPELLQYKEDLQQKEQVLTMIKSNIKLSRIFADMQTAIPQTVRINSFSYLNGVITIMGSAPTYREVAQFMVKLRQLDYFSGVSFTNATLNDVEEEDSKSYEFSIQASLTIDDQLLMLLENMANFSNDESTKEDTGDEAN